MHSQMDRIIACTRPFGMAATRDNGRVNGKLLNDDDNTGLRRMLMLLSLSQPHECLLCSLLFLRSGT